MTVKKTTTPQLVVYPLQYIPEVTEGTVPTSGTPIAVGLNSMISIKKDGQWVEVAQLGPEDLAGLTQGPQKYPVQVKYNPVDSNLLKIAVNSANYGTPTGTISTSLSFILAAYFNGTINYIVFSGVRPGQIQYDRDIGKPDVVSIDLVCMSIAAPTSSAPTGLTLVTTFLTGPAWNWLSGGANPLTDGGSSQDCKKFSITVNRNVKEDYTLGNLNPFGTQPHGRRIAWNADCLWDSQSTFESDFAAGTPRTMILTLLTSTSVLTLSNAYKTNYSRDEDVSSDMSIVETATGKAFTVGVT